MINATQTPRALLVGFGIALSGCFGAPTLPPHLGEGTDVLAPRKVSINVAAGAGDALGGKNNAGGYDNTFAAGFEARIRTGIGWKSEIGLSLFGGMGTALGGGDPPFAVGGKLSYKLAPLPWLAFVAGAGGMDFRVSATAVFGGDLAVIVAPYRTDDGKQLYLAVKGSFSVPIVQNSSVFEEAVIVPVGLQIPASERVRVLFEAGPIFGFAQESPNLPASANSFGGYGVVALTFLLR